MTFSVRQCGDRRRLPRGLIAAWLAALCLLAGCARGPQVWADAGGGLGRVAVFPFRNTTGDPDAGRVVTGAFIAGLVRNGRCRVEFPGNITSFLVRERVLVRTGLSLDNIQLMGRRLGVDAVLLGEVREFSGAREASRNIVPIVAVHVRLVDTRTGKVTFMAEHRRVGDEYVSVMDFGMVRTPGALARRVVDEVVEHMWPGGERTGGGDV